MAVEIREMVVRTTISSGSREKKEDQGDCHSLEEVKREVLAVCLERMADFLSRQKER
ncbi:MAG: DUF5908 family protein [Desulfobacterales bacterium]|nr:DUF5908 family protein [Desulfobacterales bacterium]